MGVTPPPGDKASVILHPQGLATAEESTEYDYSFKTYPKICLLDCIKKKWSEVDNQMANKGDTKHHVAGT